MVRYKLLILPILCLMLFVQSCVHGDLDDCPPMVSFAVAFEYTSHTERGDRFYDDVKRINIYVFDKDNLVYTTETALSPYDENFNIPLDLPMGNYHIVAWGNLLEDQPFSITPTDFVMGETTLDEARLILQKTAGEFNDTELEKLFYGELDVEIPLYFSRIDTVPLMNNTERVRIVLHWDHSKLTEEEIADHENVVVRLKGSNSVYNFSNERDASTVIYAPFERHMSEAEVKSVVDEDNREWLKINYYSDDFSNISKTTAYDFTILRLFKDVPLNLVVEYWSPLINGDYIITGIADVDIVSSSTGFEYLFMSRDIVESQWQRTFDVNDLFRVDMYIIQHSKFYNSFATGSIKIVDWHTVNQPSVPGAD